MLFGLATPLSPVRKGHLFVAALTAAAAAGCVGDIADPEKEEPGFTRPGEPAAPGGTAGPGATDEPPPVASACTTEPPPARIWRLSDQQYRAAVADLLPGVDVPAITTPGRSRAEFINVAELYPVSGALAVDLRTAAKMVAASAVKNVGTRLGCTGANERDCGRDFVLALATRGVRRPLATDERADYEKLYALGAERSVADGVRLCIEALLQSPSFLYRSELGAPSAPAGARTALRPWELASALSFFFTDSLPDAELLRAAEDGSLSHDEGYTRQVERLLTQPRVRATLGRVFLKWLGLGDGVTTELPSDEYPDYDEPLRKALADEATHFFDDALAHGTSLLSLFLSRQGFVDRRLAALYGVPFPASGAGPDGFAPVTLPSDQRAGFLTQGGFVVSKSRGEMVVHRGKWIREELLCGVIPAPPAGVVAEPTPGDFTAREQANMRLENASCGACHQLMDPLGLTFEHYDGMARYGARDGRGRPIDASGELKASDVDGKVNNVLELGARLAQSEQARLCIANRMMAYALGRDGDGADAPSFDQQRCEARELFQAIGGPGGELVDLMAAIAKSASFRMRRVGMP
jgi:hypothetical protein